MATATRMSRLSASSVIVNFIIKYLVPLIHLKVVIPAEAGIQGRRRKSLSQQTGVLDPGSSPG